MSATSIEWTDFTINPLRARLERLAEDKVTNGDGHYCEKISAGCADCYSSRMQPRFGMPVFQEQRRAGVLHYLDKRKLEQVLQRRAPTKYFWCDMTDMFGRWVPDSWIAACFGVMAATPQHTHQILTKRAERLPEWYAWVGTGLAGFAQKAIALEAAVALYPQGLPGLSLEHRVKTLTQEAWPLPNVHVGVSIENRKELQRLYYLRKIPAAVRFLSLEPLLEDLCEIDLTGIGWVIVGGESGSKARPCRVEWVLRVVEQCARAGVPCFVKQLGTYWSIEQGSSGPGSPKRHPKGGDPAEWPERLRVQEFPK